MASGWNLLFAIYGADTGKQWKVFLRGFCKCVLAHNADLAAFVSANDIYVEFRSYISDQA